jgi:hypothetical protein
MNATTAPAARHPEAPAGPAPRYLWAAYGLKLSSPFAAHGTADTPDDARAEAEHAMNAQRDQTDFAVILAHDGNDKIGRRAADAAYHWTNYNHARPRP